MSDQRLGAIVRFVRVRRRWRQIDVAARAGVSQSALSRIERGHLGPLTLDTLRRVLAALDVRVDVVARWRGGDLDRLIGAAHAALHEEVAQRLAALAGWEFAPEVSFSIYGERGVIDILAWHAPTQSLLVIELKSELVDLNELLGTFDKKVRLAPKVAAERSWLRPSSVSNWLIVVDTSTNRHRAREHAAMLRAALPDDGRAMRRWLRRPSGRVAVLSFWPNMRPGTGTAATRPIREARSRVRATSTHEKQPVETPKGPRQGGNAP